jgi:hypothetical protein
MGLTVSHGCWQGAYSAFSRWREKLAEVAKYPPLALMEGFYEKGSVIHDPFYGVSRADQMVIDRIAELEKQLPISWEPFKHDPIVVILRHSDCDGWIPHKYAKALADRLQKLVPLLPDEDAGGHIGNWHDKTRTFIKGLRLAARKKERIEFR